MKRAVIVFMVMWPIVTIGIFAGQVEWAIAIAVTTGVIVGSKY